MEHSNRKLGKDLVNDLRDKQHLYRREETEIQKKRKQTFIVY